MGDTPSDPGAVTPVTFDAVDPMSAEALWALGQYFDELDERFPEGFDPGGSLADSMLGFLERDCVFVVAHAAADAVACGGAQRFADDTHEIKRMWVHPRWRGRGIAKRLLADLEQRAGAFGSGRVILDTNSVLVEAIAMYERNGYRPIERYNDNPYAKRWFEKLLTELPPAVPPPAVPPPAVPPPGSGAVVPAQDAHRPQGDPA